MKMRWSTAPFGAFMLLVLGARPALACSCAAADSFEKSQTRAQVIVRDRIAEHVERARKFYLAMNVDVAEIFKGKAVPKRIRVWGDNGAQCRPYVSSFPVGTEWILALYPLPDAAGRRGTSSEYYISICGVYWLRVEGGNAVGNLTTPLNPTAPEAISLEQFRKRFGR